MDDIPRISPRLRNALVADLLQDPLLAIDHVDRLLLGRIRSWREVTEHLARQLGFSEHETGPEVHDVLRHIVMPLDSMLKDWPPPPANKDPEDIAASALSGLSDWELFAMLRAGPTHWRRNSVNCTIDQLASEMGAILDKVFAAALRQMVQRWEGWDLHRLRERWDEARKRQDRQKLDAEHDAAAKARRAARDDEEEWRRRRADKRKQGGAFTPPARTT